MLIQNNPQPLKQIIRYEQQLKAVSQKIQIQFLGGNPANINAVRDLIAEEQQLVKILEVESSKLRPESKQIYSRNMVRYKKKAKQHKQYLATMHGTKALPPKSQQAMFMEYQNQNIALAQNKLTMYENQRYQEGMNRELYGQGQKLYGGIQQNRQIRKQADDAESSIHLIQMAIMKRKIMFGSLVFLFLAALILVIILKANKK